MEHESNILEIFAVASKRYIQESRLVMNEFKEDLEKYNETLQNGIKTIEENNMSIQLIINYLSNLCPNYCKCYFSNSLNSQLQS